MYVSLNVLFIIICSLILESKDVHRTPRSAFYCVRSNLSFSFPQSFAIDRVVIYVGCFKQVLNLDFKTFFCRQVKSYLRSKAQVSS